MAEDMEEVIHARLNIFCNEDGQVELKILAGAVVEYAMVFEVEAAMDMSDALMIEIEKAVAIRASRSPTVGHA